MQVTLTNEPSKWPGICGRTENPKPNTNHTRRYDVGRDVTLLTRLLVPVHSLDVILGPRTVRSTVRSTMDCVNDRYELLQAFVWNRYSLTPGNSAMCTSVYFSVSLQMEGRAMVPDLRRRN